MRKTGHLVVSLLFVISLFLLGISKVSAADAVIVASPEVVVTTTVNTSTGPIVVTPEKNPFKIMVSEIMSFAVSNNVGVAGYVSGKSGQFQPALAVQIGQSRHGWINYGLDVNISTTDGSQSLSGVGAYAGINGVKIIEKALKKPISDKINITIGWTEMYYGSNTDKISKGWDHGLFAAVAIPF